jgi:hypothetical protein
LKLLDGMRSLLGMKTDAEPVHASPVVREAVNDLLRTPGARIRLITATTGAPLTADVVAPIHELLAQINDLEGADPIATHLHMDQKYLWNALTEQPTTAVDLTLQLQDWGRKLEPLKIYYGRVTAADVANWFVTHGTDLLSENIRVVIPRSDISESMVATIEIEPDRFGYYNNGITLLADSIEMSPAGALNREVGFFELTKASVVNGAQTVSTLAKLVGTVFEANLAEAFVLVKCIEVPTVEDALARQITRFANTQNEVTSQDFAFLDSEQHRLVKELRSLGYEYSLRAGEVPKVDDPAKWIDVRQAAVALACASTDLGLAVTAKREVSRLFSDPKVYESLFNPGTEAMVVLRAVLVSRAVDQYLDSIEEGAEGLIAGIAIHARRVVTHVILRDMPHAVFNGSEEDFDGALLLVPSQVQLIVDALMQAFPDNSYPGNVFKNHARCASLLAEAGLAS